MGAESYYIPLVDENLGITAVVINNNINLNNNKNEKNEKKKKINKNNIMNNLMKLME